MLFYIRCMLLSKSGLSHSQLKRERKRIMAYSQRTENQLYEVSSSTEARLVRTTFGK